MLSKLLLKADYQALIFCDSGDRPTCFLPPSLASLLWARAVLVWHTSQAVLRATLKACRFKGDTFIHWAPMQGPMQGVEMHFPSWQDLGCMLCHPNGIERDFTP